MMKPVDPLDVCLGHLQAALDALDRTPKYPARRLVRVAIVEAINHMRLAYGAAVLSGILVLGIYTLHVIRRTQ